MTTLGRFSTRLRQQDWLAVAIELTIVMAGVFLGIQSANWNQSRQDQAEERRYYAQIIEDLEADLDTLALAERRSRIHDRAAEITLAALRSGLPSGVSPGRAAVDIHYAGFLFLPKPARRTYDELISTGNLRLLQNQAAKDAIAGYYANFESSRQWDDLLRQQQSDYWRVSAGVVPRRVLQAAIRGTEPSVTSGEFATMIAEARRRTQLADMIVGMAAHQERVRRDSEGQRRLARQLIRQLAPLAH